MFPFCHRLAHYLQLCIRSSSARRSVALLFMLRWSSSIRSKFACVTGHEDDQGRRACCGDSWLPAGAEATPLRVGRSYIIVLWTKSMPIYGAKGCKTRRSMLVQSSSPLLIHSLPSLSSLGISPRLPPPRVAAPTS